MYLIKNNSNLQQSYTNFLQTLLHVSEPTADDVVLLLNAVLNQHRKINAPTEFLAECVSAFQTGQLRVIDTQLQAYETPSSEHFPVVSYLWTLFLDMRAGQIPVILVLEKVLLAFAAGRFLIAGHL